MVHNWYATRVHGEHSLTHEVFVGDQLGRPLDGWTAGTIDLRFAYGSATGVLPIDPGAVRPGPTPGVAPIPSPARVALLGVWAVVGRRRRKP